MLRAHRLAVTLGAVMLLSCAGSPRERGAEPKPRVYVALGASDAVGVGTSDPMREGWVPVLHTQLPTNTRLVNLGISGSLLHEALVQQLPVAIDADPDLVTVWLAVNDFNARVPLEEYRAALDMLLIGLATQTNARVFVANIPDLTHVPIYQSVPRALLQAEIERWNGAIASSVTLHGARLVDLYPLGTELGFHPDYVAQDGFHPSSEGYRRLAEVMWAAIMSQNGLP
jgi:lysophospholipase L1-like esterase